MNHVKDGAILHYAEKDFEKLRTIVGLGQELPKFPATILIDDINEVIVETEALRLKPEYHSYLVCPYPPSHHAR